MPDNDKNPIPGSKRSLSRVAASQPIVSLDEDAKSAPEDNTNNDFRVRDENSEVVSRLERLRQAVRQAGGNKVVATRANIALSSLGAHLAGREMRTATLVALADACGVTVEWLATGKEFKLPGEPALLTIHQPATGPTEEHYLPRILPRGDKSLTTPQMPLTSVSNYIAIPRYDVRASAGGGSEIVQVPLVGYIALDEHFLRTTIGRRREDLVTIEATGESMAPTIRDGSILFVDTGSREIDDGRVYVLRVNDRLLVKRLQLRANGHVILRSDNPAYPQEEVVPSQHNPLRIIGQVVYQAGPVRA